MRTPEGDRVGRFKQDDTGQKGAIVGNSRRRGTFVIRSDLAVSPPSHRSQRLKVNGTDSKMAKTLMIAASSGEY